MSLAALEVDYRPYVPAQPLGIAIVGTGAIVRSAHLPAYRKYGLPIVGAYDIQPASTEGLCEEFGVGRIYRSLEELLDDRQVEVVDVATRPEDRAPVIRAVLAKGKHVLAQKPVATSLEEARDLSSLAARAGLKLAVNQNGRWAPPWRVATQLIRKGVIGQVLSITHVYDMSIAWSMSRHFDDMAHFLIYDYSVHFFDITRCWLEGKRPRTVRARDFRVPDQPAEARTPWSMWAEIWCDDGTSALIRGYGGSATGRYGHPFWIHGSLGTIRGSVLGQDGVELHTASGKGREARSSAAAVGMVHRYTLEGNWFPDGFAGTMGELLRAIETGTEPENSLDHNLLSLELTLAAVASAERDGAPVTIRE